MLHFALVALGIAVLFGAGFFIGAGKAGAQAQEDLLAMELRAIRAETKVKSYFAANQATVKPPAQATTPIKPAAPPSGAKA